MIKFGAIVPHPPILIPNIGKENQRQLENTIKAYEKLKEELRAEEIETVIIISAHGPIRPEISSFNLDENFEINFEEFGDFSTKLKLACDLELTQGIREFFTAREDIQLVNFPVLDHGSGVPLFLLCYELKNIKVVSFYISGRGLPEHYRLGKEIAGLIAPDRKKTAIIASGDLSHCLSKKAPCKYSPKGAKFDQRLIECLKEKKTEEIISVNEETLEEIKACGPRSIAVLLGALSGLEYETKILAYEYPFGIGNLTTIHKVISSDAPQLF